MTVLFSAVRSRPVKTGEEEETSLSCFATIPATAFNETSDLGGSSEMVLDTPCH
jgi:hypothetical protein